MISFVVPFMITFRTFQVHSKSPNPLLLVTLVDFSDEQMLIDMVRENITHRDTDFHDTREGIVLSRNWLQSKCQSVKLFNTLNVEKGKKDFQIIPDSYRSIANFLSKNSKAVSYVTVKNYLDVT